MLGHDQKPLLLFMYLLHLLWYFLMHFLKIIIVKEYLHYAGCILAVRGYGVP